MKDSIRTEAERIANSYRPTTAGDRAAAAELAADDKGDLIAWARSYVRPHLQKFLDRIIRDGERGGRNTEKSFDFMAWLGFGYSPRADISVFFQRMGMTEEEAARAIDSVRKVENLDERGSAEVCARFLRGYLGRVPADRELLWGLMGVVPVATREGERGGSKAGANDEPEMPAFG